MQHYFLIFYIISFYFTVGLIIKVFFIIFRKISTKIFPKLSTYFLLIESGIIISSFVFFYLADKIRFVFFVVRSIAFSWYMLIGLSLLDIIASLLIALIYTKIATLIKAQCKIIFVTIIILTILIPIFLKVEIADKPFNHQRSRLLSNSVQPFSELKGSPAPTSEKVILFGMDGATWELLHPLIEMGHCPVMERLVKIGVSGRLETIIPTLSPVIWTTIATGMLPNHHGIQHFARFKVPLLGEIPAKLHWPEHTLMKQSVRSLEKLGFLSSELYTSQMRRVPSFYEIISNFGEAVSVLNWWCSWPIKPLRGDIISERFSYSIGESILGSEHHRSAEIFPTTFEGLYRSLVHKPDELDATHASRFMNIKEGDIDLMKSEEHKPWFFSNWFWFRTVYQSDRTYFDIGMILLKKYRTRLFAIYQQSIDVVEHHYWQYIQPEFFPFLKADEIEQFRTVIPATYDYEDTLLAQLLDNEEKRSIIIVSDHGMLPTKRLPKSGDHVRGTPAGIFLASGKSIEQNKIVQNLSVTDVTPFLLVMMGYPVGSDMDGRVPTKVFKKAFLKAHPPHFIETYGIKTQNNNTSTIATSPTDKDLFKKLKGLGYLN